jgi:hypothetical protein
MSTQVEQVEELITKAAGATDSRDAMAFAQAALNAAHALCELDVVRKNKPAADAA